MMKLWINENHILGWFGNRTGTSVDDDARKSNNWFDQHRGKTSTHAPAWAFPVCFSVTLSSQIKVSRALLASFCVQLVVQLFWPVLLYAARVFDYFVVIEIAFMDNQAQITETITRLDSEKVRW